MSAIIPTKRRQRAVVIFSEEPRLSRQQAIEALTGLGPRHPAWRAMRQLITDHWSGWNESSLTAANAGTPQQTHACGAEAGLAEVIADMDELMERAVKILEGPETEDES